MNAFRLRRSEKSDLDFIIFLIESTFKEHIIATWGNWDEKNQYEFWRRNLNPSLHEIIIIDNTNVGLLSVIEDTYTLELDLLFLIPEFQNKGIGKKIVADMLHEANQKSKRLKVKVLRSNIRALKFYKSLDFRVTKETEERLYLEYSK